MINSIIPVFIALNCDDYLQLHTLKVCVIKDFNAFRGALIDFMIWYGSKRSYMKHMLWCVNQFHTLQFALHLKCSYLAVKKVWSFRFFLWQLFVHSTYVPFITSIIILLKGSGTLNTLRSMKNETLVGLQTKIRDFSNSAVVWAWLAGSQFRDHP